MSERDHESTSVCSTGERGPMTAETLEALRGSIAKWERIVAGTGGENGSADCPLCQKFNSQVLTDHWPVRCNGCPVYAATGQHGCRGTPYHDYDDAVDNDEPENVIRDIAMAELEFLKSLLPKEAA